MKTALVSVDITNQYYAAAHNHPGAKIDYEKYLAEATKGYNLYRAFAYGVQMNDEAHGFITALRTIGYEPKYRQAVVLRDRPDIRNTDRNMLLAMDVWRVIDRIDVVVIGSNDPDLAPLVNRIKELGIQVIVFSCGISRELKDAADRFIEIGSTIMERRTNAVATSA